MAHVRQIPLQYSAVQINNFNSGFKKDMQALDPPVTRMANLYQQIMFYQFLKCFYVMEKHLSKNGDKSCQSNFDKKLSGFGSFLISYNYILSNYYCNNFGFKKFMRALDPPVTRMANHTRTITSSSTHVSVQSEICANPRAFQIKVW